MQGLSLGELLPAALGVALSPLPIAAVILMLFSTRAKANGLAFIAGWVAGLLIVGAAVLLLGGDDAGTSSQPSQLSLIVKLLLGLLLLAAAFKHWRGLRHATGEPQMPKWMRSIDDFSTPKAFGVAVLLSGVNPKNLALNVSGVTVIAQAKMSSAAEWTAFGVFVLLSSLTVAVPVVYYLVGGKRSAAKLDSAKTWLIANNSAVMMVLLLIFGVKLLADGVQGLIG